jgi:hypothetical protein
VTLARSEDLIDGAPKLGEELAVFGALLARRGAGVRET